MNRYAAAGISTDAELDGKRIIVITSHLNESRAALDDIAGLAPAGAKVSRANGAERIDYPSGGRVIFRSYRQGTRGLTADTLYLDTGVDAMVRDNTAWDALHASLRGSTTREIIRA